MGARRKKKEKDYPKKKRQTSQSETKRQKKGGWGGTKQKTAAPARQRSRAASIAPRAAPTLSRSGRATARSTAVGKRCSGHMAWSSDTTAPMAACKSAHTSDGQTRLARRA
nr:hypothetical protein [Pandoravirus belohorizontensis]